MASARLRAGVHGRVDGISVITNVVTNGSKIDD